MKVQIRTKRKEGKTPLYIKLRMGKDVAWVSLMLSVDIEKWLAASGSERKISNLLDKLGYTRKLQEIEFAIKDLRRRHRLTKENVATAIDSIVLADKRSVFLEKEKQREMVVRSITHSFKKSLEEYVNSAVDGTRRHSFGESFSPHSKSILNQFKRIMLNYLKMHPFDWVDLKDAGASGGTRRAQRNEGRGVDPDV